MSSGVQKDSTWDNFLEVPGGQSCLACQTVLKCRDLQRLMKHLTNCPKLSGGDRSAFSARYKARYAPSNQQKKRKITYLDEELPSESEVSSPAFGPSGDRSLGSWIDRISPTTNDSLSEQFAMAIFQKGLAFSIVEAKPMIGFLKALCPSFQPPSRKTVANSLLDRCHAKMVQDVGKIIAKEDRLTLVSDGWTNVRGESIINYLLVTPSGQSVFHSADASGTERHTGEYLAAELSRKIQMIGPHKINAICTDTASNMLKAVREIKTQHPHIHTIGCNSHQLNLAIKDILELPGLKTTLHEALEVSRWFRNHQVSYAKLKDRQKELCGREIALYLPVSTQWQPNAACLRALITSRNALEVVTVESEVSIALAKNPAGKEICKSVSDADWSSRVSGLLRLVEPFCATITERKHHSSPVLTVFGVPRLPGQGRARGRIRP